MSTVRFQFVNTEEQVPDLSEPSPASYVRFAFVAPEGVQKATLYTTALGVYEPYFNGERISEQRLLPGFTNYNARVQYLTTDISAAVVPGKNVVSAIVGDGWYRGNIGAFSGRAFYGDYLKFAATVCLETADGEQWIYTDSTTKATQDGPIQGSDLKTDEIVDMRKEIPGWNTIDFDDSTWHTCVVAPYSGSVIPQEGEDILEQEYFSAKVLHTPIGQTVLDFGQNMAGHVAFTVTGKAGQTVKLVLGEALDENGNFTLKNISLDESKGSDKTTGVIGRLGQTVTYTLKDGTQSYKSVFLT